MESGISIYHVICLIAGFLSISMGFFLLFIKSQSNRANVYLGLLLLSYSLFFLPGFLEVLGILEDLPHIIRLNFFSGTLTGPLTYLYCRASIHEKPLRVKDNVIHFAPFLLSFIWIWPTLIKSGAEKLDIYQIVNTQGKVPESKPIIIIMLAIVLIYTLISIRMTSKYLQYIKNTRSNLNPSFHRWLLFLSYTLILPIIVVSILTFTSAEVISTQTILFTLAFIVLIMYFSLIIQPKFFHSIPHKIPKEQYVTEEKSKYQNSYLQNKQKEKYLARLLLHMETEKPHLDPKLNIADFSGQLNIAPYYVSQIINEKLEVNFLDFVNQYRIEDVKAKLTDNDLNHFTIVTLAYESGFNSKTAFYAAFKKNVGCTPSKFRNDHQTVEA